MARLHEYQGSPFWLLTASRFRVAGATSKADKAVAAAKGIGRRSCGQDPGLTTGERIGGVTFAKKPDEFARMRRGCCDESREFQSNRPR